MADFTYRPLSTSTDPAQIIRDMTERHLRGLQRRGRVPITIGVTRPMPKIENAVDAHRAMESWRDEQKATYGGYAADGRDTPVEASYSQRRWDFLSREEAVRESAYDDATGRPVKGAAKGKVHIGVGFNMDRPDARQVVQRVLGLKGKQFDDLYTGKTGLSPTQIRKLFDYTADEAEAHVERAFKGVPLSEHRRLALVSLAFNNPSLLGPQLTAAVRAGDHRAAAEEIALRSGSAKDPRLKGRRSREALMFFGHSNLK